MCRSIKTLRGAEPAPTQADLDAAALQFVRKLSGYRQPSVANRAVFDRAVVDVARATAQLLEGLQPGAGAGRRTGEARSVTR